VQAESEVNSIYVGNGYKFYIQSILYDGCSSWHPTNSVKALRN